MPEPELPDLVRQQTQVAWHSYLDVAVPFRRDLYRYCRSLTSNPWDAEDLVQDTLLRAFGTLGSIHFPIDNARGYLVRTATNLWIDKTRRRKTEESWLHGEASPIASETLPADALAARNASAILLLLPPQERAAVLLKDVLEMSLEEIAEILATTIGAVKAALHRGRARLHDSPEPRAERPAPSPELIDRFIERLNASDLSGLLALMLDTATIRMPGALVEKGRKEFSRQGGWLWQAVNVHADLPAEFRPPKWINASAIYLGETVMLSFAPVPDISRLVQSVTTFEERDGKIASIRAYVFSPEVVNEVATQLGLQAGNVGYQLPQQMREAKISQGSGRSSS